MSLSTTRKKNFPQWYQDVIQAADMAENSMVRGCMVIKPWGYGIWERIQRLLDDMIKETGHDNCYFPLLIPLRLFEKEAEHIDGFAKEMAMVTHTKLTNDNGQLKIDGQLDEPLVIRPTSETVIAESMSKWIQSYRDLPLKLNQWANVMRWEMRTRLFLRTAEFLWQEGHTAHATAAEAESETLQMLEIYRILIEDYMAIPVITGPKSPDERFPGAVETYTLEAMMQDGKALQMGTSHYLGQTFAKAAHIQYQDDQGDMQHVHTTSWGVSTRLIGGLIMTHSDDIGLRLPPRIAPKQIVIVPIIRDENTKEAIFNYAKNIIDDVKQQFYGDEKIRIHLDDRNRDAKDKKWDWIKKGVPIVLEIGQRDVDSGKLAMKLRHEMETKPDFVPRSQFIENVVPYLDNVHQALFQQAKEYRDLHLKTLTHPDELNAHFKRDNGYIIDNDKNPGFVRGKWCEDIEATTSLLKEKKLTIRVIPQDQSGSLGKCLLTGRDATLDVIYARSY